MTILLVWHGRLGLGLWARVRLFGEVLLRGNRVGLEYSLMSIYLESTSRA